MKLLRGDDYDYLFTAIIFVMGVIIGGGLATAFSKLEIRKQEQRCCELRGGKWLNDHCFKRYEEMKP